MEPIKSVLCVCGKGYSYNMELVPLSNQYKGPSINDVTHLGRGGRKCVTVCDEGVGV